MLAGMDGAFFIFMFFILFSERMRGKRHKRQLVFIIDMRLKERIVDDGILSHLLAAVFFLPSLRFQSPRDPMSIDTRR